MLLNKRPPTENYAPNRRPVIWDILSRPLRIALTACLLFLCSVLEHASAQSNQTSPLGTNLFFVGYSTPEQPFLNILKTGSGWAGNRDRGYSLRSSSRSI